MNLTSPLRRCLWLLLVSVATTVVLIIPATLVAGWMGLQGLLLSAVLCLAPGLGTVVIVSAVKDPTLRVMLVVGGMVLRMLVVLLAALAIQYLRPEFGLLEFYIWLIVFYNVLLLAETWLLLPRAT